MRKQGKSCAGILSLAAALTASQAQALSWTHDLSNLLKLPTSSRNVTLSPFNAGTSSGGANQGFALFQSGARTFEQVINATLRERLGSPLIEMRATSQAEFGLKTGSRTVDVRFFVGGVPLHGFQARAHALSDGSVTILGTLPNVDTVESVAQADWPRVDSAYEHAVSALNESGESDGAEITLKGQERVFYVANDKLIAAWRLTLAAGDKPFVVVADADQAMAVERGFFDVTGHGSAFAFNTQNGAAAEVDIPDLTGDGTLTTEFLKSVVPTTYTKAQEPTNVFDYPATDRRFDEVQAFTHAQTHFAWFKNLGFEWYGTKPLEIRLHVKPGGRSNNALFVPGSSVDNSPPSISIDDGDGIDLQNLATDGDVVSHEFGHHVIYKTLRSTDGESLVLHEGLADFFVFSRTGDACLGESICPADSTACILQGQCLRSAELDLKYNDAQWAQWAGPRNKLGHLHGQLISGLLWDLRKSGDMAPDDVSKLIFKAISFFKEDSGFADFVVSLLLADRDVFAGANFDKITAAANARGLGTFATGLTKDAIPDTKGSSGSSALPSTSSDVPKQEKKENKGSENPLKCGVIPGALATLPPGTVPLALLLLLPILIALRPVPAKERARVKKKR